MNGRASHRSQNRARLRNGCLWLGFVFLLSLTHAGNAHTLLLVRSADSALHQEVESAFRATLAELCKPPGECPRVETATPEELESVDSAAYGMVVLVGLQSSRVADQLAIQAPHLHILVSEATYQDQPACCEAHYVLPLEQPIERQLAFARFLMPERRRIGVLLGANSQAYRQTLQELANTKGLKVVFREVEDPQQVGQALFGLRNEIDLLFSLPDPSIYNRETWPGILLTSYREQIPVIGYSHALVHAGALAALYSTGDLVGQEAARQAWALFSRGKMPGGAPTRFKVSLNRRVARSLHLRLPTDDEIEANWRSE